MRKKRGDMLTCKEQVKRQFSLFRSIKMSIKHQLKAILVTEDGVNFLLLRELYVNDLRTGRLLDGKHYQGRTQKQKILKSLLKV